MTGPIGPREKYNRRPVPDRYDRKWLSDELGNIQRGVVPSYAVATGEEGVTDARFPIGDPQRYGAVIGANTSAAQWVINSRAVQRAIDYMDSLGGGVVTHPGGGPICLDAVPIVYAGVWMVGTGRTPGEYRKMTATPSTITDATIPVYTITAGNPSGTAIGFPVCVLHFVGASSNTALNYSYGGARNITVAGNTTAPNTSVVQWGMVFNGASNVRLEDCRAQYIAGPGFIWGVGASIFLTLSGNVTYRCHRGYYQHFSTASCYANNYVIEARYGGFDLSAYYSLVYGNGCDHGANAGSGRTADTELFTAYRFYSCTGTVVEANGSEDCNGQQLVIVGTKSCEFRSNAFLNITSDHDNVASGLKVDALQLDLNVDVTIEGNRFVFAATKLSGDAVAASHFNWRETNRTGYARFNDNRFVDSLGSVTPAGWSSGTPVVGALRDEEEIGTFTPVATFATPGDVAVSTTYGASNAGKFVRRGTLVMFDLDLDVSALTWTTASGALRVSGLPYVNTGLEAAGAITFHSAGITYPSSATSITPSVVVGASYLVLVGHKSATTSVTLTTAHLVSGVALRVQLSGRYQIT